MLKLFNTLSKKKETFKPLKDKMVGLYTCGPTVYYFAHIGNLRSYLFEDILKRVLAYASYKVKHVMNITDVGHLTSNSDTGQDKMEKGAAREKKTVWQIAEFYTKAFKDDLEHLNIREPDIWIKATDTIKEQIELIMLLEKKGFTYTIKDGVYFDTSKLKTYGRLTGKKKKNIKPGARVEMIEGKKNPTDFALWKIAPEGINRQMEWNSPWGRGFPGWHTECVVMSIKELGIPFDIHCGGIDHIPIHHPNEIAQAEAAYNKPLAKFWMHGDFLVLKDAKMAKSKGTIITIQNLIDKEIDPLSYRYFSLNAHYRSKLTFTWQALKSAQISLNKLKERAAELRESKTKRDENKEKTYQKKFIQFIENDLDMPKALALTWQMLKDKNLPESSKHFLLNDFDKVFGLNLSLSAKEKIPQRIKDLAKEREDLRENKQWQEADRMRKEIEKLGFQIKDTEKGPEIKQL